MTTKKDRFYDVEIPGIGTITKRDESIAAARRWARAAFGPEAKVRARTTYRLCADCCCAPCSCKAED